MIDAAIYWRDFPDSREDCTVREAYVGFYWTRPVPSVGFLNLSPVAAGAASKSKTIRYQRELVQQYVRDNKGELVDEIVFLELSPDRGTVYISEPLDRAANICVTKNATLLYVEFWSEDRWRRHNHMISKLEGFLKADIFPVLPLPPIEIMIDGHFFSPKLHFASSDKRMRATSADRKAWTETAIRALAEEIPPGRGHHGKIRDILNERNIGTPTGNKQWTADNVRKLLKKLTRDGS